MKSYVMIDKDEYDAQAHIPKVEYDRLVKECTYPITERAMFVYDKMVTMMRENGRSIRGEELLSFLEMRRPVILEDLKRRFPNA